MLLFKSPSAQFLHFSRVDVMSCAIISDSHSLEHVRTTLKHNCVVDQLVLSFKRLELYKTLDNVSS